MTDKFQREERYIVFKVSDLGNSLKGDEIRKLAQEYAEQRRLKGKKPLECVVVEKDWPEYEPTWKAIEARVTGAQPAPIIPEGWLRAIDEALAIAHSGVVNADDTYEQAKAKLDNIIGFHVDGATEAAVNGGWKPIPEKHPTFDLVDLRLADGSVLCGCVPQSDGDYWWNGPSGEVFIDPKYAPVTHWRLSVAKEAKP